MVMRAGFFEMRSWSVRFAASDGLGVEDGVAERGDIFTRDQQL